MDDADYSVTVSYERWSGARRATACDSGSPPTVR